MQHSNIPSSCWERGTAIALASTEVEVEAGTDVPVSTSLYIVLAGSAL